MKRTVQFDSYPFELIEGLADSTMTDVFERPYTGQMRAMKNCVSLVAPAYQRTTLKPGPSGTGDLGELDGACGSILD